MDRAKPIVRTVVAIAMMLVGVLHFLRPIDFVRIVPSWLPAPLWLVYISGVAEVAGGVGLLLPRYRRTAGWGLIALYIAVFPANVQMALDAGTGRNTGPSDSRAVAWGRLPLQLVMAWAALQARRRRA